jgi:hypothetical protein
MSRRKLSWPRLLGGAVIGAIFGQVVMTSCAYATGALLGGDEPAGTVAEIMLMYGSPLALAVGTVLGGQTFGFLDRRLFATIGGAILGVVVTYVAAIPVSIVYGGALDTSGVMFLLGYGLPLAVAVGAIWARRRYRRWEQSRPAA